MAGWWRGLTLLLVVLCSVSSLSAASDVDALQGLNQDFSSRKLLQAVPPTPRVTPPTPTVAPPTPVAAAPVPATGPVKGPGPAPARPPVVAPAPTTQVRTYLMWVGIGAFCLVLVSVAVFCLCRKFGQQKVRGAQRLPPLPRYH